MCNSTFTDPALPCAFKQMWQMLVIFLLWHWFTSLLQLACQAKMRKKRRLRMPTLRKVEFAFGGVYWAQRPTVLIFRFRRVCQIKLLKAKGFKQDYLSHKSENEEVKNWRKLDDSHTHKKKTQEKARKGLGVRAERKMQKLADLWPYRSALTRPVERWDPRPAY